MDAFGYRFSARAVEIVESFIDVIEGRELVYSEQERAFARDISAYKNAQTLLIHAIEVLSGLRSTIEQLQATELKAHFQATQTLLSGLLSPTMEATSWSYKSVTISRGATPAPAVTEIRLRSIQLLRRLHGVAATIGEKLAVVNALHDATRSHGLDVDNEQVSAMIVRDSAEVLSFYEQLVRTEDLQVVQRIESNSYWIYYHAHRNEIKAAALAVERAIAEHAEYQIYRVLVAFEGVFGEWAGLTKSERDFSATDEARRRIASEYAAGIARGNYEEWRRRILTYAKTESEDLATFPVFYFFLEAFAKSQPQLALMLVKNDTDAIERSFIPVLRGLWAGSERPAVRSLIESWIDQAHATRGAIFSLRRSYFSQPKR